MDGDLGMGKGLWLWRVEMWMGLASNMGVYWGSWGKSISKRIYLYFFRLPSLYFVISCFVVY